MTIDLLAIAIELIAGEGLEFVKDKAKRKEGVLRVLNKLRFKLNSPLTNDFDGVYAYTLVLYGIDKPKPILEFFRHEFIKSAFRKSFKQQDESVLEEETENFLDWNEIGKELIKLDYDPRREFAEFRKQFIEAAKSAFTVPEALFDQKLNEISTEVLEVPTKVAQLIKEEQFLRQRNDSKNVSAIAPLFNVPSFPLHYLERKEYTDEIKRLLLTGVGRNVGITGVSHTVGLQGMGGIGKSILAAVIAHDDEIRAAFPDGIVWVQLGQSPNIVEAQSHVLESFDEYEGAPISPGDGLRLLKNKFRDKKILLILDDVWKREDIKYFDVSFEESRLLITTRQSQILTSIDAEECKVDVLSQEQSLLLLRKQSRWADNATLPESAQEIVKQCGGLPLALSMIGAMLRNKPPDRWGKVLAYLKNADLNSIKQIIKDYPHRTLFTALHVSIEDQPLPIRNCYLKLAVFPEVTPIPESVLDFYWDKEDLQGKDPTNVIDELVDASLIFRYDDDSLMLHDLQRAYVSSQCGNVQILHQKMVDAYAEKFPNGWDSIPVEKPYYFQNNFGYHLQQLGNKERAKKIAKELLNGHNNLTLVSPKYSVEP